MRYSFYGKNLIGWKDHWTNGGTGITKFSASELPLYQKTVKEFNNKEVWLDELSLHSTLPDLDDFWDLYRKYDH